MEAEHNNVSEMRPGDRRKPNTWVWIILLLGIVMVGAYFRFTGINWDDNEHMHPDERFMTMVETSISPVENITEYFDTNRSSLNPNNRGYGFYVYGTLPLFLVRYIAEWVGQTGYDQVHIVGRALSAVFDLSTILLVYLIAQNLYKRNRLSLMAAALYAFSALAIQLSHYFTVDTFTNFFVILTIYLAVRVMVTETDAQDQPVYSETIILSEPSIEDQFQWRWLLSSFDHNLAQFVLFGTALGLAMSSKVSAVPVAILLPLAVVVRLSWRPLENQKKQILLYTRNLVVAAIVSFVVFRVCQPYAFMGPGFLGVKLNPNWISSLKELSLQSSGAVDFPPALQWARRPIWYSFYNMVRWGMGFPFGVVAWIGFLWIGWRMMVIKGEWRHHGLIWVWTAFYFSWQSINFSRNMRYQLHVYPTLAIMAAWFVFQVWDKNSERIKENTLWLRQNVWKVLSVVLGVGVLVATFAWAFAFSRIYSRPLTRVEASHWIYQNIPGAINLKVDTSAGKENHPQPFKAGYTVNSETAFVMAFFPETSGELVEVDLSYVRSLHKTSGASNLIIRIAEDRWGNSILSEEYVEGEFLTQSDPRGDPINVIFNRPQLLEKGNQYYLLIETADHENEIQLMGSPTLVYATIKGMVNQYLPEFVNAISEAENLLLQYRPKQDEVLYEIDLPHVIDWEAYPDEKRLQVSVYDDSADRQLLGEAALEAAFLPESDPRGQAYSFSFRQPVALKANQTYYLQFKTLNSPGQIAFYGIKHVKESSWDDVLPIGVDGYNPFDHYMGVYSTDLNFEMYWDDNAQKLERFLSSLDQADYIFISSNRQWGTTTRVPERYPLTTEYYRQLIGCPSGMSIIACYSVAEPGMFEEQLGFELIKVFQSDPNIGNIRFNTQFADESFTVYDHPKVLIFRKSADYSQERAQEILSAVDLSMIAHSSPKDVKSYPGNLLLPEDQLSAQRSGGTWSELFDRDQLVNRQPLLGLLIWYVVVFILGLVNYPFVRLVFRSLSDKGYPFSRLVGLVLLAYFVWLAGSNGIPFNALTISIVFVGLLLVNIFLFLLQKEEILQEIRDKGKYFLVVEGFLLAFFLVDLLIRVGNPDLWHPYKGGEKPMDFSYLNAVIKSTTFPPYDPWFTGGYVNYYYYGFVLVGVLIKWLGIIPSLAYNFVLPTLFSFTAAGAFSIGWNLLSGLKPDQDGNFEKRKLFSRPMLAGLSTAIGTLILGNLGTVRMIWHALQRIAAPDGAINGAGFIRRLLWTIQGFIQFLGGTQLPIRSGDWYWVPSRVLPAEPITEFPFFTFLYADLHAHMIALPITLLVLGWAIAMIKGRWRWGLENGAKRSLHFGANIFLGALAVGALRPTNTWDLPVYLGLSLVAIVYTYIRYARIGESILPDLPENWRKAALFVVILILFTSLVFLSYKPFGDWYGQGYNKVKFWEGDHSPFWSYFTHWGLFLFLIISWLFWETRDWMAKTPFSSLKKLTPYQGWLWGAVIALGLTVLGSFLMGIQIAWLSLLVSIWAAVLIFRPGQSDEKRMVLFLIGTGMVLTLAVELIVLEGDIGRMNTVFKFYLQAWTLLSISAAASLMWLLPAVDKEWLLNYRASWKVVLALLVGSAALFPVFASIDKIRDRMSSVAPHTLDGMTYMAYSRYFDADKDMVLFEDYKAIQWMQDHVQGSPTIVEANASEYKWGNRFTIYTGLPGVVGWNWHQRQQRAVVPSEWITDRVTGIADFYNTTQQQEAQKFLKRYDVQYVVVGQLERAYYEEAGLDKFPAWEGVLWKEVYRDGETVIYSVLDS